MRLCPSCSKPAPGAARFCPECGAGLPVPDGTTAGSTDDAPTPPPLTSDEHGRLQPGQILGSRYRIVARLGWGGTAEVYRADDLEPGQSVALKFLPVRLRDTPNALERLCQEGRLARGIVHPNVWTLDRTCGGVS